MSLESFWMKKSKLPKEAKSTAPDVLNSLNKVILKTNPTTPSTKKRGKYKNISPSDGLLVAKYASKHRSPKKACNLSQFAQFDLRESTVRGWKNKYKKSLKSLGRHPLNAEEAGLIGKKRGRNEEENMENFVNYMKSLRKSGADINRYTTMACLRAYLTSTKQTYMLQEFGGWIGEMDIAMVRQIWKKAKHGNRKKCRKRRGKLDRNAGIDIIK